MASCDLFRKAQIRDDISLLLQGRMTESTQKKIDELKEELNRLIEKERNEQR